jgi:hypothetical protein
MIYYLWVDVIDDSRIVDNFSIGFYSSPELVIDGAKAWLEEEYDEDLGYSYYFCVSRGELNTGKLTRIDISYDTQDQLLTKNLHAIGKEYMKDTK